MLNNDFRLFDASQAVKFHKIITIREGYIMCNSAIVGMSIALLRNDDES